MQDGQLVSEWKLLDLLDPYHQTVSFGDPFWDLKFPQFPGGTKDWSHGNSLQYIAAEDSMLASLGAADWIVKISRSTGQVVWRLGEGGDLPLQGGGEWFRAQHAAAQLPNGNILLFDNGHHKAVEVSRAVEYAIYTEDPDPANWYAEQVWEFHDSQPFYSAFSGDVDLLPNGNVLITDGARVVDQALDYNDPSNLKWARIVEVTHEEQPEKVFEMILRDEGDNPTGYTVYTAEKMSLYPDDTVVEYY